MPHRTKENIQQQGPHLWRPSRLRHSPPTAVKPQPPRALRGRLRRIAGIVGIGTLRGLLLLLLLLGLAGSLLPQGRAVVRAALILPALVSASQPLPLQVAGEPISHRQMTVPSQSGTVYLDVFAPTSPTPPPANKATRTGSGSI